MTAKVLSSWAQYSPEGLGKYQHMSGRIDGWMQSALAYVWGRQEGGDTLAYGVDSHQFASLYTLACVVNEGVFAPLFAAFHEYVSTGRMLVTRNGRVIAVETVTDLGAFRAEANIIPFAGRETYWGGVKPVHDGPSVCMVKHNV